MRGPLCYRAARGLQREVGEFCGRDADGDKQEEHGGFGERSDTVHVSRRPAVLWTLATISDGAGFVLLLVLMLCVQGQKRQSSALLHVGE